MTKVSIIVPVYNAEVYLEQCINSVLAQTMREIEVICVDDCSTDKSYEILNKLSDSDARIKVYRFDKSKSALQARKKGIMMAEGEYIMFLDADDFLEVTACEKLYDKIRHEDVDILHFSSRVVNCANVPQQRIEHNEKLICPFAGRLSGKDIFNACFHERRYCFQLWNKVYRADLCKMAFADLEDQYLPRAQDFYTYFVISYYAQSYFGWITEPLHSYCFGRGVTGSSTMNLDKFERYCTQANIIEVLKRFCQQNGVLEQCQPVIDKYYEQWITECVKLWKNELPKEVSLKGLEILYRYWGSKKVIAYLAKEYWFQRDEVAQKLEQISHISLKNHEVKTVAFYYYHFSIGGVQRVISLLVPLFLKMGYKTVIITDSEPAENDYVFPEGVIRATVLNREMVNRENFENRLDSWSELIQKYHFDLVLYNAWTSNVMLWDMLFLKDAGIPVVIHAHNVFSMNVTRLGKMLPEFARTFSLVDGIVTLSEADKAFWDAFNSNVHHILNPVSLELHNANRASWENKSLIWIARVSDEKQPWLVFKIMAKVLQQVPEAKLYLLGNFDDSKWTKMAEENGITEHVEFCGMIHNVNDYYEKATVHVVTSRYEGFLMTLLESMAHSLPTVAFDMPNLTLAKEARGVISVDMQDVTSAANEIVKLLNNRQHWEEYSQRAKQSYEQVKNYDIETAWKNLLTGNNPENLISQATKDMLHTMVNHYDIGVKYQQRRQKEQEAKLLEAKRKANEDVRNSVSYKIGRVITFLPRKIRGAVWCCRDHGVAYTVKLFCKKVKGKLM